MIDYIIPFDMERIEGGLQKFLDAFKQFVADRLRDEDEDESDSDSYTLEDDEYPSVIYDYEYISDLEDMPTIDAEMDGVEEEEVELAEEIKEDMAALVEAILEVKAKIANEDDWEMKEELMTELAGLIEEKRALWDEYKGCVGGDTKDEGELLDGEKEKEVGDDFDQDIAFSRSMAERHSHRSEHEDSLPPTPACIPYIHEFCEQDLDGQDLSTRNVMQCLWQHAYELNPHCRDAAAVTCAEDVRTLCPKSHSEKEVFECLDTVDPETLDHMCRNSLDMATTLSGNFYGTLVVENDHHHHHHHGPHRLIRFLLAAGLAGIVCAAVFFGRKKCCKGSSQAATDMDHMDRAATANNGVTWGYCTNCYRGNTHAHTLYHPNGTANGNAPVTLHHATPIVVQAAPAAPVASNANAHHHNGSGKLHQLQHITTAPVAPGGPHIIVVPSAPGTQQQQQHMQRVVYGQQVTTASNVYPSVTATRYDPPAVYRVDTENSVNSVSRNSPNEVLVAASVADSTSNGFSTV